jgi:hypothetical protein
LLTVKAWATRKSIIDDPAAVIGDPERDAEAPHARDTAAVEVDIRKAASLGLLATCSKRSSGYRRATPFPARDKRQ